MKRFLKTALVCVLATLMLASVSVFANAEMANMQFVGYDVELYNYNAVDQDDFAGLVPDWNAPKKVYQEVINGMLTGKVVYVDIPAKDVDWKFEGYEAEYPYAGYYRLYLEGNATVVTDYKGDAAEQEYFVIPTEWETRDVEYMWELAAPYYIWERQQTLVNGYWKWDMGNARFGILDSAVCVPTPTKSHVDSVEFVTYGVAGYANNGAKLTAAEKDMYDFFKVGAAYAPFDTNGFFSVANLSARNPKTGVYEVTDAEIAAMIPVVKNKVMTARFYAGSDLGLLTKNVASEFLKSGNNKGLRWDNGVAKFECVSHHNVHSENVLKACDAGCTLTLKNALGTLANSYVDTTSFYLDYTAAKIDWSPVYHELSEPYRQFQYLIVNDIILDGQSHAGQPARELVYRYTGGCHTPVIEWRFAFYEAGTGRYVEQRFVDGVAEVDGYGNGVYRTSEPKFYGSYQTPEGFVANISTPNSFYANYSLTNTFLG